MLYLVAVTAYSWLARRPAYAYKLAVFDSVAHRPSFSEVASRLSALMHWQHSLAVKERLAVRSRRAASSSRLMASSTAAPGGSGGVVDMGGGVPAAHRTRSEAPTGKAKVRACPHSRHKLLCSAPRHAERLCSPCMCGVRGHARCHGSSTHVYNIRTVSRMRGFPL